MQNVTPKVYLIASTKLEDGFERWLVSLGADEYGARINGAICEPLETADAYSQGEALVESAARRCYQSFQVGLNPNVTKVRTDSADYHRNVLASGHGSVLAHCTASFAIENVSRVWTGEMNRHWAGLAVAEPDGISEGSMRYIRLTEMKAWNPWAEAMLEIKRGVVGDSGIILDPVKQARYDKLAAASKVFTRAIQLDEAAQEEYERIFTDELAGDDFMTKKVLTSRFRRTAPMGVATGGVWTFNMRSLRHVLTLRSGEHVEEEMAITGLVVHQLGVIAKRQWPMLFQDIKWMGPKEGWVGEFPKV